MIDSQNKIPDWASFTSYERVGCRGHYINSNCILTQDKILRNRSLYYFVSIESDNSICNVQEVLLLDAYCNNGSIYLFLNDIETDRVLIIDVPLIEINKDCPYMICDRESYSRLEELIAIKSYCQGYGSC